MLTGIGDNPLIISFFDKDSLSPAQIQIFSSARVLNRVSESMVVRIYDKETY